MFFNYLALFIFLTTHCVSIKNKIPPKKETIKFMVNNNQLTFPVSIIAKGLKPNLPNDFISKILPKMPTILFPVKPKLNLGFTKAKKCAPKNPEKILNMEINVCVIVLD
ncbi:hypothetical protein CW751_04760 [Brumimicrobium salinarum]|uniref:Uncharacterized protein n=1 Tax=Brumimicrobium salinarum TaxID=2058658 RepID=A0A2I0R4Q6_9FLAO|nr:hypothetical protein CW751_04760 [Brumimicrobium salinarum]